MTQSLNDVMESVRQQLLASADAQYKAQMDVLQREHQRHIAGINAIFGYPESGVMDASALQADK